jgi:hypothetical protein
MKTHDAIIYHCLTCGGVVHAEPEAESPQCCGHTMVKAAGETIHEADDIEAATGAHCETEPPLIKGRKKPR